MDDRFVGVVAGLSLLFWILARERRIDARIRVWLLRLAYLALGLGVIYALVATIRWFAGSG